jgi:hypothetical protein
MYERKPIPGFEGYFADTDGEIWSVYKGKGGLEKLTQQIDKFGKKRIRIRFDHGKKKSTLAHRLILLTFVGPCPPGMECCHNDGNGSNNVLSNLRWDTRKSNRADSLRHGTRPLGEKHWNSKLTSAQVLEMREKAKTQSMYSLAKEYKLSKMGAANIIKGVSWGWLKQHLTTAVDDA